MICFLGEGNSMIKEHFQKTDHKYRENADTKTGYTEKVVVRKYCQMSADSFENDLPSAYSLHLDFNASENFSCPKFWWDVPDYSGGSHGLHTFGSSKTLEDAFVNPKTLFTLIEDEDEVIFVEYSK